MKKSSRNFTRELNKDIIKSDVFPIQRPIIYYGSDLLSAHIN